MNPDFSELSLLVVDDSPINHRIVTMMLRNKFKLIDSAFNGLEAVKKYKTNHYDVILMDVMMPVMDGSEATIAIRNYEHENGLTKKTKIIAMTASDSDENVYLSMDAYMGKPFLAPRFFEVLEELS